MKPDSNPKPRSYRKLWVSLIAVIGLSFLVLGYYGGEIYRKAPPIPETGRDGGWPGALHRAGHQGWPERLAIHGRTGGRHHLGPRRLCRAGLVGGLAASRGDLAARISGPRESGSQSYEQLPAETQAALRERLKQEMRRNTYDPETGDLVVSPTARRRSEP